MLTPLIQLLRWFLSFCLNLWRQFTGTNNNVVVLDTGRRIRVGKQIAEGGFSCILEGRDDNDQHHHHHNGSNSNQKLYALKRIYLVDREMVQACLKEIGVHQSVLHPNLMPVFGVSLANDESVCYILFPFVPHSLRAQVNELILNSRQPLTAQRSPWSELDVLRLFLGIVDGVGALHDANYTHRDVKLENVLLQPERSSISSKHHHHHRYTPILTDFGSAGAKVEAISTRRRALEVVEEASQHTTMPYRPPELFEGGVRAGDNEVIDYTKVDVWSLGCTLFGMLYGASPFECEFRNHHDCPITIVECSQLRILGDVPTPPPHSVAAKWYSPEIGQLIRDMLHKDRHQRPTLPTVMTKTENLIRQLGGKVRIPQEEQRRHSDFISSSLEIDVPLTSSNRIFV